MHATSGSILVHVDLVFWTVVLGFYIQNFDVATGISGEFFGDADTVFEGTSESVGVCSSPLV